jgi:hypothetical protein
LELTKSLKTFLKETAQTLKGHERRRFMAKTIEQLVQGDNVWQSENWDGTAM